VLQRYLHQPDADAAGWYGTTVPYLPLVEVSTSGMLCSRTGTVQHSSSIATGMVGVTNHTSIGAQQRTCSMHAVASSADGLAYSDVLHGCYGRVRQMHAVHVCLHPTMQTAMCSMALV